MSLIAVDNDKAFELYSRFLREIPAEVRKSTAIIVVQHIVPNTSPLVEALAKCFSSVTLIPKPRSVNPVIISQFESARDFPVKVVHAKRDRTSQADVFFDQVAAHIGDKSIVILDVGGYFAESFVGIGLASGGRLIGVIEDTENGHQKYLEALSRLPDGSAGDWCPIYSVARSPLKEPEDHLVGQSIVYSTERILRDNSALITNKQALVIGYGKIGKSVAAALSAKNVRVWVHDNDEIRRAQALSHGFFSPERNDALEQADLVISATGNKALRFDSVPEACDFRRIKGGCFVASVTSADDEFELDGIDRYVERRDLGNGLLTYKWIADGKLLHMLNGGDAVNFAHTNTLGPYIYLVACEILACLIHLLDSPRRARAHEQIFELLEQDRQKIARAWREAFFVSPT